MMEATAAAASDTTTTTTAAAVATTPVPPASTSVDAGCPPPPPHLGNLPAATSSHHRSYTTTEQPHQHQPPQAVVVSLGPDCAFGSHMSAPLLQQQVQLSQTIVEQKAPSTPAPDVSEEDTQELYAKLQSLKSRGASTQSPSTTVKTGKDGKPLTPKQSNAAKSEQKRRNMIRQRIDILRKLIPDGIRSKNMIEVLDDAICLIAQLQQMVPQHAQQNLMQSTHAGLSSGVPFPPPHPLPHHHGGFHAAPGMTQPQSQPLQSFAGQPSMFAPKGNPLIQLTPSFGGGSPSSLLAPQQPMQGGGDNLASCFLNPTLPQQDDPSKVAAGEGHFL